MPSTTAMRQCPELVFVRPRFDVYRAVSRQIQGIFADYTALIEPLALDEAYLDVTENRRGLPTASATAKEIRTRIFQETGLTASAGVSYNKFLAKLASGQRKPNGQFVITPDAGADFIASLPVAKLALSDQSLGPSPAVVAWGHEQPVPVFQQLARSDPSGRDDVREIPAVAAQGVGSPGRARDRHQP